MPRHLFRALPLLAALVLPAPAPAQSDFQTRFADGQPPVVIAHRSADFGDTPENSLAWIAAAIARGVDVIHINPQLTGDGRYILMHDNTLNRMTDVEDVYPDGPPGGPTRDQRGGRDYVRDYTLDEISRLRLGTGDNEFPVPTLAEALDFIDGRVLVMLGLKTYEVESLAAVLTARDTGGVLLFELYFSGTDQSQLRALAEATGLGVAAVLFRSTNYAADLEGIADQLGPALEMVGVDSDRLTPEFLAEVAARNLLVEIGGWNGLEDSALLNRSDPGPWQAMFDLGFAALTDQPDLLLDLLGR